MAIRFLLDENIDARIWSAIRRHNRRGEYVLDVVRVGESEDLPCGSLDPWILRWAERQGRVLLSFDRSTLARHLADHLAAGGHSPGIVILAPTMGIPELVSAVVLIAYASEPGEWADQLRFA